MQKHKKSNLKTKKNSQQAQTSFNDFTLYHILNYSSKSDYIIFIMTDSTDHIPPYLTVTVKIQKLAIIFIEGKNLRVQRTFTCGQIISKQNARGGAGGSKKYPSNLCKRLFPNNNKQKKEEEEEKCIPDEILGGDSRSLDRRTYQATSRYIYSPKNKGNDRR